MYNDKIDVTVISETEVIAIIRKEMQDKINIHKEDMMLALKGAKCKAKDLLDSLCSQLADVMHCKSFTVEIRYNDENDMMLYFNADNSYMDEYEKMINSFFDDEETNEEYDEYSDDEILDDYEDALVNAHYLFSVGDLNNAVRISRILLKHSKNVINNTMLLKNGINEWGMVVSFKDINVKDIIPTDNIINNFSIDRVYIYDNEDDLYKHILKNGKIMIATGAMKKIANIN